MHSKLAHIGELFQRIMSLIGLDHNCLLYIYGVLLHISVWLKSIYLSWLYKYTFLGIKCLYLGIFIKHIMYHIQTLNSFPAFPILHFPCLAWLSFSSFLFSFFSPSFFSFNFISCSISFSKAM